MADSDDLAGQAGLTSGNSAANLHDLRSDDKADKRRGLMPVRIVAVYGGGPSGMATADVMPLVHQADGLLRPTPHGTIYGVSVGRQHSGSGGLVSDPVVGDVYALIPADRDMSKVKASGGQASAPDTKRRSSLADGVLSHALISGSTPQGLFCKPGGGVRVYDKSGALSETTSDGMTMWVMPAPGGKLYLGGDPSQGGTFSPIQTVDGPSSIVFAKVS